MGTPHNDAEKGQIAKTVLMPGDPLRAEFIAKTWLPDAKLVNRVRNNYAFTGRYHGKEITVMASGMGIPSMGIYSYELFSQYDVEHIIRIGTAGSYCEGLNMYDVVLAQSCFSESSFGKCQNGDLSDTKYSDPWLDQVILKAANDLGKEVKTVKVRSGEAFYRQPGMPSPQQFYQEHGCECGEMESFALFHNAQVLGRKASCLLTISDELLTGKRADSSERQTAFVNMIEVALEAALILETSGEGEGHET